MTGQTSEEWVFAGGDAVSGPSSVIEAIAAGEKAAVGMHAFLRGAGEIPWRDHRAVDTFFDPDADPVMGTRPGLKLIPVTRRKDFTEVETTWSATVALSETKRCLRCDYREPVARDGEGERAQGRAKASRAVTPAVAAVTAAKTTVAVS